MSDRKTKPTDQDVDDFLASVEHPRRRADTAALVAIMHEVTGEQPTMWGTMIGFGRHVYTTADGKERETFAVGCAARKQALTIYGLTADGSNAALLEQLGPHTSSKACVYVKRFEDLDHDVLRKLIKLGWEEHHHPE